VIKAAVLGSPIAHSLSPLLHRTAYESLGIEAEYSALDMQPDVARTFLSTALESGWTGFSLTMPLKETIFDLNFKVDPLASRMRSANTLVKDGSTFKASSTDASAFARLLERTKKDRVAIIGGGGTARAALGALDSSATSIDFLLRTPSRSQTLENIAQKSRLDFFDMSHDLRNYDLVISTVPSGASAEVLGLIKNFHGTFFEVLYNPSPTRALQHAQAQGNATFDGLDLLVEQALDQISLFSGVEFDYASMRAKLLEAGRAKIDRRNA